MEESIELSNCPHISVLNKLGPLIPEFAMTSHSLWVSVVAQLVKNPPAMHLADRKCLLQIHPLKEAEDPLGDILKRLCSEL